MGVLIQTSSKTLSASIYYVMISQDGKYEFRDIEFVEKNSSLFIFNFSNVAKSLVTKLEKLFPTELFEIVEQQTVNL